MDKVLVRTFKEFVTRRSIANSEEELIELLKRIRYPKRVNFRCTNWIVTKTSYIDAKYFELSDVNIGSKGIKHISVNLNIENIEIKYGYEVYREGFEIPAFVPDRKDGPAIHGTYYESSKTYTKVSNYEYWYADGKLHRTDGPAVLVCNCFGEVIKESWYVKGEELNEFQITVAKGSLK